MQYKAPRAGAEWTTYLKKATTWKICDQPWGPGKAWSTMGTSGTNYRARACRQQRNGDGVWVTSDCTSYFTIS